MESLCLENAGLKWTSPTTPSLPLRNHNTSQPPRLLPPAPTSSYLDFHLRHSLKELFI